MPESLSSSQCDGALKRFWCFFLFAATRVSDYPRRIIAALGAISRGGREDIAYGPLPILAVWQRQMAIEVLRVVDGPGQSLPKLN